MSDSDWISTASLDQLKAGYVETEEHYTCLFCGKQFEKGIIYPAGGLLFEAGKYARVHLVQEHQSVFAQLLGLDKSVTGLSDLTRRLLWLFYQGKSDVAVQKELAVGSTSTIRNHRFLLKEKERQARVFLAIMELLRARDKQAPAPPGPSTQTTTEPDKLLKKYFPHGTDGPLKTLTMPEKHRLIVLTEIAKRFEAGRRYTETEVNQALETASEDYGTLRRYLVDYGFLDRLRDGSEYWLAVRQGENHMDRKSELRRLAKETKTDAGVYQIKNSRNGKLLVESTPNLKTINGKQFALQNGSHPNKALQQEWQEFGQDTFTFDVLEVLERPETGYFHEKESLAKLKAKWLNQLQPFGERGYNTTREQR